jgi:hypothetical protein
VLKKIFNKVKDTHNQLKDQIEQNKNTGNGKASKTEQFVQNMDGFNPDDTIKKGLEIKNDIFVAPPEIIPEPPVQVEIKAEEKLVSTPAENPKNKIIIKQLTDLADKLNLKVNGDISAPEVQKKLIMQAIASISSSTFIPPVISLTVCSLEKDWMDFQSAGEIDIETNINYNILVLKNLRKEHKNWPKAIISYFHGDPPGIGKPSDQKEKALIGIKTINRVLEKMENNEFKNYLKVILGQENDNFISHKLLLKELIDYQKFILKKYL